MKRILSAILASCLATAAASAQNLLINGGFESGPDLGPEGVLTLGAGSTALPGWEITRGSIDCLGPPSGFLVAEGERAIDLDGRGTAGAIAQTFSTTPGSEYVVSFYLSGNPEGSPQPKQLMVSVDTYNQTYSVDTTGQYRTNLLWQQISFSFTASSSSATLTFQSLTPGYAAWGPLLDGVEVQNVPEPGAVVLLSVGGMVYLLVRTRRRHG